MTLALSAICDVDCVVTLSPAMVDWPVSEAYARGSQAILRRVFYRWVELGVLDLDGASMADEEVAKLRRDLEDVAEDEDYVISASVTITVDGEEAAIVGRIRLVDGAVYTFSVSTADAVSVNFEGS